MLFLIVVVVEENSGAKIFLQHFSKQTKNIREIRFFTTEESLERHQQSNIKHFK